MKKKIFKIILGIVILITYLILGSIFKIYIRCPIHEVTGFYCPGCGLTRMLTSMLKLDFYQAFRYNPLLFISTPLILFLFINKIYCEYKNKNSIYKKIPSYVWYILIVVVLYILLAIILGSTFLY